MLLYLRPHNTKLPSVCQTTALRPLLRSFQDPILAERDLKQQMQSDASRQNLDASTIDFESIVQQIRRGDQAGIDAFFRIINRGVRFFIARQLRYEVVDDTVHDAFVAIITAIQKGQLREPSSLMAFSLTIVRRMVAEKIHELTQARKDSGMESGRSVQSRAANPEQLFARSERIALMRHVLKDLSSRDREILVRFYLREQSEEQICEDLGLTGTQFRLLKSRAKNRFGELGHRKLNLASLYALKRSAEEALSSASQAA